MSGYGPGRAHGEEQLRGTLAVLRDVHHHEAADHKEQVDARPAERGERLEDFQRTYFYSDSLNDLPLLSLVSHPVAVDPDPTLRAHAARHGWPVITLR